jgi:AcrR family transcriptional regulator
MNDTREHILKTAFVLFLQKSFKEVTMQEIVQKTGLSKGAFYHYFVSKEQLFSEVVDAIYFKNLLVDYSKLNKNSLLEFYHEYVAQFKIAFNELKSSFDNDDTNVNINFITILFDALRMFPRFKDKLMKIMKEELDTWTDVVRISRSRGEFTSPMTDEQIARMFIYSNDGVGLRLLLEGKAEDIYTEMLTLWDNFYKEVKD